jgi:hypothetical protein
MALKGNIMGLGGWFYSQNVLQLFVITAILFAILQYVGNYFNIGKYDK